MDRNNIEKIIQIGLLAGIVAASVSAIGMVRSFNNRDIITGTLTLGQLLLFAAPVAAGYLAGRQHKESERGPVLISGFLAGLLTALPLVGMIALITTVPGIRAFADDRYGLVNMTPALVEILTFGLSTLVGTLLLMAVMGVLGLLAALVYTLPQRFERPLITALLWTLMVAVLSDVFRGILRPLLGSAGTSFLFGTEGLRALSALLLFVLISAAAFWWRLRGRQEMQERLHTDNPLQARRIRGGGLIAMFLLLMLLPFVLGQYLTNVMDSVGLYVLMGLGLNIVVGFAGLLDLGYVAFFAIGAYTMGILTSQGALGIADLSFWVALPICVGVAMLAGLLLGTPVLRMRGDYLAIVTLGFGEIIRILAMSDLLKPYIGGAQGILQLPKPEIFGTQILRPQEFYYLILAGCALVAFVSWRLRDARLGRQWMAMREDEDVAEAMGINLVKTKLLAFGIGAAFSGLAGAISAARIGSIFPHSFDLLISINVLSLIIVGGIGSLPGVVVGAIVLVGLPELLTEFEEYRLLMYGALLIAMMVARPEGLWPSPIRQRELHEADDMETFPSIKGKNPFTDEPMAEQVVESPGTAIK